MRCLVCSSNMAQDSGVCGIEIAESYLGLKLYLPYCAMNQEVNVTVTTGSITAIMECCMYVRYPSILNRAVARSSVPMNR